MKIPKGKKIILGNRVFVDEVPEKFLTPELKKAYEKKFGTSKKKTGDGDK